MEQNDLSVLDRIRSSVDDSRSTRNRRQYRRVPPAITPLSPKDLVAGIAAHRRGTGRERFQNAIGSFLDAEETATYTSFRRTLCACLREVAAATEAPQTDVLIPAFCSSDFPDAIEGAGLETLRYDIDAGTLSFDTDAIERLPTENAAAIVVVNVLGYSSPMEWIEAYCRENEIYLIEALGYAYGSEYNGQRLGTFGDCSVLNFQQGKPIPVGGGMVVSRNTAFEFTDEGRSMVAPNFGMLSGYAALAHPRLYYIYSLTTDVLDRIGAPTGRVSTHPESKFDVSYSSSFATISDFQGGVGRSVLDRLPKHRHHRKHTAEVYATELADCPHARHLQPIDGLSNHQYVRYPLVIDTPERRDKLRQELSNVGIETAALYDWPPIDSDTFPGAARLQDGIITLPTHPYVDGDDRELIVQTVRNVLHSN